MMMTKSQLNKIAAGHGNAREQLEAVVDWLGWQDESLSFGLRSADDAVKLWKHAQANPDAPEMWDEDDTRTLRRKVLGYDPMSDKEQQRAMQEVSGLSASEGQP